jgi:hypothetical protein
LQPGIFVDSAGEVAGVRGSFADCWLLPFRHGHQQITEKQFAWHVLLGVVLVKR